ncbi:MAG: cell division protein SepF [Candidatus Aenigmarchaeota archaeon]|nr:cell division protein SepF [Candidatus Aenigmarchaeota archaeon]
MPLRGFLHRVKKEELPADDIDYIELDGTEAAGDGSQKIRIATLNEFADTEMIQQMLREGSIVFVKIRALKDKDMTELKRSVDRLRKTCVALEGDIAGIDEDYLVITPNGVRVHRG